MLKKISISFWLLVMLVGVKLLYAQPTGAELDAAQAATLYTKGLELMKKENFKAAIETFNDAVDLDSSKASYQYQLGLAYFYNQNFEATIKVVKNILDGRYQPSDRYYQLLGQSYRELRQPLKAYKVFEDGLKVFPKSGAMHTELGKVEYDKKNFNLACQYWENGVMAEPDYPSNYYYLAKAYSQTTEKLWTLIYGEIFCNLEINSSRTYTMSKLIYDTYLDCIIINSEKRKYVYFSDVEVKLTSKQREDTNFYRTNFELAYQLSAKHMVKKFTTKPNLSTLTAFRQEFVNTWYRAGLPITLPNALFEYQRKLISEEYFECYTYWLMSRGDLKRFNEWYEVNRKKYNDFLLWLQQNPLTIDNSNVISRLYQRQIN